MTTATMLLNDFVLPWEATRKEDERFRKTLKRLLLIFLLLAIVFPWLPLPEIVREQAEIVPPVLAKVILQQKLPVLPPPPKPDPVQTEKSLMKAGQARKNVATIGVAAFTDQLQSLRSSLDVAKLQARNTNVTTGAAAREKRSVRGRDSAAHLAMLEHGIPWRSQLRCHEQQWQWHATGRSQRCRGCRSGRR